MILFSIVANRLMRNPRSQRAILSWSYFWHRRAKRSITWVVGPDEIASMVRNITAALPGSHSVSLAKNRFYDFEYGTQLASPDSGQQPSTLRRLIAGPWLLGKLARQANGFIYLGSTGFLLETDDCREYEFAFLRGKGLRLVCYFTGSDIRSPKLMRALQESTGEENIATYLGALNPVFLTDSYDAVKRTIAAVADRHAQVIFNARVDQLSYLQHKTEPFLYFYPDADFVDSLDKFDSVALVKVVHAPSAPILKGTQIVRAAVRQLKDLGYEFDYVELVDRPHQEVLAELRSAHIALNEFYAFVPGVFGVEAMAAGCVLMTRADEMIETDLPPGSNAAWLVTGASRIFDNLKALLDDPSLWRPQATRGQEWARANAASSRSGDRLKTILEAV